MTSLATATRTQIHPNPTAARQAAQQLIAAGTPASDVQLLVGRRARDIRHEVLGGFAGPVPPDAPVGTFGGVTRLRSQAAGGWGTDPDRRRQGSFGDAEHDEAVSFDQGREVSRTVDRRALRALLRPVVVDAAHGDRLIDELHQGHALVLTAHAHIAPDETDTERGYALRAA